MLWTGSNTSRSRDDTDWLFWKKPTKQWPLVISSHKEQIWQYWSDQIKELGYSSGEKAISKTNQTQSLSTFARRNMEFISSHLELKKKKKQQGKRERLLPSLKNLSSMARPHMVEENGLISCLLTYSYTKWINFFLNRKIQKDKSTGWAVLV